MYIGRRRRLLCSQKNQKENNRECTTDFLLAFLCQDVSRDTAVASKGVLGMKETTSIESMKKLMKERQWVIPLCLLLGVGQCLTLGLLFLKHEKIVVIPSTVYQEFWVEKNKASTSYLEEMGVFVTQLWLNVTPDTAQTSFLNVLKYVASDHVGRLKPYFYELEKKIKRNHLSLNFIPKSILVKHKENKIFVEGELNEYMGDKKIRKSIKTYVIFYAIQYGRFLIQGLEEKEEDPKSVDKKEEVKS